ncbi:MAG: DUF569 domain-containing protein [Treponema sp.]|jgi:hypothetical protein|nr:DUF569 domain-containing protein [Treponema sp.]
MSDKQNGNFWNSNKNLPEKKGSEMNFSDANLNLCDWWQPRGISGLISLKSYQRKYLSAWPGGEVDWDRDWDREWEQFTVESHGEGKVTLKSCHGMYLSAKADADGTVRCDQREASDSETWTMEMTGAGIALKSCFGKYLHPKKDGKVRANQDKVTEKESFTVTDHSKEGK